MKLRYLIIFSVALIVLLFNYQDNKVAERNRDTPIQVTQENPSEKCVGYDWENNREITMAMSDTMFFTGGHWYSTNNPPPLHNKKAEAEEVQWIRPAGSNSIYRKSEEMERMWRQQNEKKHKSKSLTEDDIRDIIRTEYER